MQNSIARIEKLSHRYNTSSWAIKNINFEIGSKGVLGLLGSNGAGKSTTMNIICGVLNQTEGDIWIDGINLRRKPEDAKKLIGFLPQVAPLYLELTIDEYLRHCAYLRLMNTKDIPSALVETKERCGIAHFNNRIIRNLSGGYRQRVGIAQAIIHKPKLVVLDEATNGLDPNQILEVRKLIQEIAEERSVIFSSHILSEVQATCKNILMIEQGQIVFSDTMEAFNNYIEPNSLIIQLEAPPSLLDLSSINGVTNAEHLYAKNFRLQFGKSSNISEIIIKLSVEKGWRLTQITLEKSSLDEIFARLSNKVNN